MTAAHLLQHAIDPHSLIMVRRRVSTWSLTVLMAVLLITVTGLGQRLVGSWWSLVPAVPSDVATPTALELREERDSLRAQLNDAHRQLQDLAAIQERSQQPLAELIVASGAVLRRSDRAGYHTVSLDVGASTDGVIRGLPVVLGWSLVGVVAGEDANTSLVRLVTDRHSSIPAMLLDTTLSSGSQVIAYGACVGTGNWREMELQFIEDRENLHISPGQVVVTAGGPGPIPRGMILGSVTAAQTVAHSDMWEVMVQPWRDSRLASRLTILYPQQQTSVDS